MRFHFECAVSNAVFLLKVLSGTEIGGDCTMKILERLFKNNGARHCACSDPENLPGTKKQSFVLPFRGGEIWFDDVLIRKGGLFVIDELKGLNPENLM